MIKVQASHGDWYEIPCKLHKVFRAMDESFLNLGLSDEAILLGQAWDLVFERFLIEE